MSKILKQTLATFLSVLMLFSVVAPILTTVYATEDDDVVSSEIDLDESGGADTESINGDVSVTMAEDDSSGDTERSDQDATDADPIEDDEETPTGPFTLSFLDSEHGHMAFADGGIEERSFAYDEEVELMVVPEAGYQVAMVVVYDADTGEELDSSSSVADDFYIYMPENNIQIEALFEEVTEADYYTLTLGACEYGTLSFYDASVLESGRKVLDENGTMLGYQFEAGDYPSINAVGDDGYIVSAFKLYNTETGTLVASAETSDDLFTFAMPAQNLTAVAEFTEREADVYGIAVNGIDHAMLTLDESAATGLDGGWVEGDKVTVTATLDDGYEVTRFYILDAETNEELAAINTSDTVFSFDMVGQDIVIGVDIEEVPLQDGTYFVSLMQSADILLLFDDDVETDGGDTATFQSGDTVTIRAQSLEMKRIASISILSAATSEVLAYKETSDNHFSFTMPKQNIMVMVLCEEEETRIPAVDPEYVVTDEDKAIAAELQAKIDLLPTAEEMLSYAPEDRATYGAIASTLQDEYFALTEAQQSLVDPAKIYAVVLTSKESLFPSDAVSGDPEYESVDQDALNELIEITSFTDADDDTAAEADDSDTSAESDTATEADATATVEELQEAIDALPTLEEVTDVSAIDVTDVVSDVEIKEIQENNIVSYSDNDAMYVTSSEADELYLDVLSIADEIEEAEESDEDVSELDTASLTDLTTFYSVGVSLYSVRRAAASSSSNYALYDANYSTPTSTYGRHGRYKVYVSTSTITYSGRAFCVNPGKDGAFEKQTIASVVELTSVSGNIYGEDSGKIVRAATIKDLKTLLAYGYDGATGYKLSSYQNTTGHWITHALASMITNGYHKNLNYSKFTTEYQKAWKELVTGPEATTDLQYENFHVYIAYTASSGDQNYVFWTYSPTSDPEYYIKLTKKVWGSSFSATSTSNATFKVSILKNTSEVKTSGWSSSFSGTFSNVGSYSTSSGTTTLGNTNFASGLTKGKYTYILIKETAVQDTNAALNNASEWIIRLYRSGNSLTVTRWTNGTCKGFGGQSMFVASGLSTNTSTATYTDSLTWINGYKRPVSFTINKQSTNGTALNGVYFLLEKQINGKWTKIVYKATSGGKVTFSASDDARICVDACTTGGSYDFTNFRISEVPSGTIVNGTAVNTSVNTLDDLYIYYHVSNVSPNECYPQYYDGDTYYRTGWSKSPYSYYVSTPSVSNAARSYSATVTIKNATVLKVKLRKVNSYGKVIPGATFRVLVGQLNSDTNNGVWNGNDIVYKDPDGEATYVTTGSNGIAEFSYPIDASDNNPINIALYETSSTNSLLPQSISSSGHRVYMIGRYSQDYSLLGYGHARSGAQVTANNTMTDDRRMRRASITCMEADGELGPTGSDTFYALYRAVDGTWGSQEGGTDADVTLTSSDDGWVFTANGTLDAEVYHSASETFTSGVFKNGVAGWSITTANDGTVTMNFGDVINQVPDKLRVTINKTDFLGNKIDGVGFNMYIGQTGADNFTGNSSNIVTFQDSSGESYTTIKTGTNQTYSATVNIYGSDYTIYATSANGAVTYSNLPPIEGKKVVYRFGEDTSTVTGMTPKTYFGLSDNPNLDVSIFRDDKAYVRCRYYIRDPSAAATITDGRTYHYLHHSYLYHYEPDDDGNSTQTLGKHLNSNIFDLIFNIPMDSSGTYTDIVTNQTLKEYEATINVIDPPDLTGEIHIHKVNEDDEPIEGAVFGLWKHGVAKIDGTWTRYYAPYILYNNKWVISIDEDTNTVTYYDGTTEVVDDIDDVKQVTAVSDANGDAVFDNLPYDPITVTWDGEYYRIDNNAGDYYDANGYTYYEAREIEATGDAARYSVNSSQKVEISFSPLPNDGRVMYRYTDENGTYGGYTSAANADGNTDYLTNLSVSYDETNMVAAVYYTEIDYPTYGHANMKKVDALDTSVVLAGAEYTIYEDAACTVVAKDEDGNDAVLVTTSTGSNTVTLLTGTYYAKETTPPDGYTLSSKVYPFTVDEGQFTMVCESVDDETGEETYISDWRVAYLNIKKQSDTPGITDDNACYSLEGAVYNVYSDEACTIPMKNIDGDDVVFVTDANGDTKYQTIPISEANQTVYIKEVTASKGYAVTVDATSGTMTAGEYQTVTCMETPKNDPIPIQLYKYDATDPDNLDSSSVLAKNKLEGAIFKLEYFDNEDGKTTGGAKRTWYFMTDEDGYLDTNDLSYLAPNGTQIKDSNGKVTETVSNSAFYKDADGNTTWPIGTYRYTEVQAPSCYVIDGTISVLDDSGKVTYTSSNPLSQGIVIRAIPSDKDTSAHRVDFFVGDSAAATSLAVSNALKVGFSDEEQSTGKITIKKVDENGKALSNVTFKLAGENGDELTGTTNSAGVVEFKDVTPQIYRITEISTRDGKSLLTDAITISYPYTFTEEELTSYGISKTTAQYDNVTGTWQLYDLSFTISNDLVFELPMTGGDGVVQKVAAGAALFAVLLGGAYLVIRKRRAA